MSTPVTSANGPGSAVNYRNGNGAYAHGAPASDVTQPDSAIVVLLVGSATTADSALRTAFPTVRVEHSPDWFDALARMQHNSYAAVIAPIADVRRRPETAILRMRESARGARVVLLATPEHELTLRKLLRGGSGCDDYLISPVTPSDLARTFAAEPVDQTVHSTNAVPGMKGSSPGSESQPPPSRAVASAATQPTVAGPFGASASPEVSGRVGAAGAGSGAGSAAPAAHKLPIFTETASPFALAGLAVAEIMLDALWREPHAAAASAIRELNSRLPWPAKLELRPNGATEADASPDRIVLTRSLPGTPGVPTAPLTTGLAPASATPQSAANAERMLCLTIDRNADHKAASDLLEQITPKVSRLLDLQDRHTRLQRIAITDDLTGLYNCRYFKHALDQILTRSRNQRTPVTLLMFDIDNFKKYNDTYGHGVGDEILRQTGRMMRRCVRDHDVVARLGGDEFAVVFWEKDGPRAQIAGANGVAQPPPPPGRPPQSPVGVFQRFKRLIAGHDFEALGATGKGELTISGGLAVYPYDANTAEALIEAADKALMFGAKKSGKNTVHLVGTEEPYPAE